MIGVIGIIACPVVGAGCKLIGTGPPGTGLPVHQGGLLKGLSSPLGVVIGASKALGILGLPEGRQIYLPEKTRH